MSKKRSAAPKAKPAPVTQEQAERAAERLRSEMDIEAEHRRMMAAGECVRGAPRVFKATPVPPPSPERAELLRRIADLIQRPGAREAMQQHVRDTATTRRQQRDNGGNRPALIGPLPVLTQPEMAFVLCALHDVHCGDRPGSRVMQWAFDESRLEPDDWRHPDWPLCVEYGDWMDLIRDLPDERLHLPVLTRYVEDLERAFPQDGQEDETPANQPTTTRTPPDLITTTVVIDQYGPSRSTIMQYLRDGKLTSHRAPCAASNAEHIFDRKDVEKHWARKS